MLHHDLLTIIAPAFVAGLLVIATHVPLGREVLKRGIIFIDLAIAQIAALGVVVAELFFHEFTQPFAFAFALGAAWLFSKTEAKLPEQQEALIGSVFVVTSSFALLLLANQPHGGEEIQQMLAGQILWVKWEQLGIATLIYVPILWVWFADKLKPESFYYIFAITITISVQMVGVYLVFASLILPALAVAQTRRHKLAIAYIIGLIGLLVGMTISTITDLPTGPVIVCSFAMLMMLFFIGANQYPHLFRRIP